MSPDALSFGETRDDAGALRWDLPGGWVWSSLAQVAAIHPPTDLAILPDGTEIPFIPMTAVAQETGAIDTSRRRAIAAVRKGYVRFREGDVIFAKITPCMENGKIAPVHGIEGGYAAGSTEFHVLRPGCIDTKYLWYWLVRRAFRAEAEHNMSGSAGQLRVPVDYLRLASIPVPPAAEQQRIVARIDELFAEIAEGEAALQRARQGLETWRRALLKAAVTGELTRDWREANRPTETGDDLLARIRAERKSLVPKSRRRPPHATIDAPDTSLEALPEGWGWTTWQEVGVSQNGRAFPSSEYTTDGIKLLRPGNLYADGSVRWNEKNSRYLPVKFIESANDLLLCRRHQRPCPPYLATQFGRGRGFYPG